MNNPPSPQNLLEQILQIPAMEHGSLTIMRQGPNGPYYNLNSWEDGANHSRYVPREKLPQVRQAIEGYQRFLQLTQQYASQVITQTRAQLGLGLKKKAPRSSRTSRPASSSPKTRRSTS